MARKSSKTAAAPAKAAGNKISVGHLLAWTSSDISASWVNVLMLNFLTIYASAVMAIRLDYAIIPLICVIIIGFCCYQFSKLETKVKAWEAEKKAKETETVEEIADSEEAVAENIK